MGHFRVITFSAALLLSSLLTVACGGDPPEPVKLDESGTAVLPEEDGTKRITPQQVAFLRERGIPFLFLDTRSREDHRQGRPAGSVNVPLQMTDLAASRLPGDRLIVTFCT
jgi:hypothetical protein